MRQVIKPIHFEKRLVLLHTFPCCVPRTDVFAQGPLTSPSQCLLGAQTVRSREPPCRGIPKYLHPHIVIVHISVSPPPPHLALARAARNVCPASHPHSRRPSPLPESREGCVTNGPTPKANNKWVRPLPSTRLPVTKKRLLTESPGPSVPGRM